MKVRDLITSLKEMPDEAEIWMARDTLCCPDECVKVNRVEQGAINAEDSEPGFWSHKELSKEWAPDEVAFMNEHYPAVCLWPAD